MAAKRKKNAKVTMTLNTDAYNGLGVQLELAAAVLDLVHDRLGDDLTSQSAVYATMQLIEQAQDLYGQL